MIIFDEASYYINILKNIQKIMFQLYFYQTIWPCS